MNVPVLLLKYLELRWNEHRSAQALARSRLRKFRKLVRYVAARSPYYAGIIRARGIDYRSCVPEDFPVLTKRILMEHFDEIVTTPDVTKEGIAEFLSRSHDTRERYKNTYVVLHTSGSSGEIGYFVYSPADWARGYALFSRLHASVPRRTIAYYAATQGHFAGISLFLSCQESFLKLLYRARSFEINGPLQPVLDGINAFQPDILSGYPSAITALAEKQLSGELAIAPSFVECGGEPLGPEERAIIRRAFGERILDVYATTEHLLMGIGRPPHGIMDLYEDDLILELHEDHTCVTNLFNRTLPLIRYRLDDVLEQLPAPSEGYPLRRAKGIVGRMEHAPRFLNRYGQEDFICPIVLVELHVKNLRRFQLVLRDKTSFLLRVCLEQRITEEERRQALSETRASIRTILDQKEMSTVTFDLEETDDLPADPRTGKFRLIVHP